MHLFMQHGKNVRHKCCIKGRAFTIPDYPLLMSLPPNILSLCTERIDRFGRNSVTYNSILSHEATGIDNGTGGGWETAPTQLNCMEEHIII